MPTGVYVRTEECNQAHRVKRPGSGIYQHSPEQIQRLTKWAYKKGHKSRLGKPHSQESKTRMSKSHKGYVCSEETKRKIGLKSKGNKYACKFGETILTPEYKRQWSRNHYAKNIEKFRYIARIARHNRRTKGCRLTKETVQIVYEDNIKKYGTLTCYLCEKSIDFGLDSLEHKIPLSRGGTNEYCNLAVAHIICNKKKQSKTETEYKGGM
jgi:5-methylcytosine-specific restriction endonuclease McrA